MSKKDWGAPVAPEMTETATPAETAPDAVGNFTTVVAEVESFATTAAEVAATTGLVGSNVVTAVAEVESVVESVVENVVKLVKMWRDPAGPTPHTADVHPAEVATMSQAGWNVDHTANGYDGGDA